MSESGEADGQVETHAPGSLKRKSAQLAWLGTEDQLCRAVKRLQTTSRPSSAVTSQDQSGADARPCSADEVNSSLRTVPRSSSIQRAPSRSLTAAAAVQHGESHNSDPLHVNLDQLASVGQQQACAAQDQLGLHEAEGISEQQVVAPSLPGLRADQQTDAIEPALPAQQQPASPATASPSMPRPTPKAYTVSRQPNLPAISRQLSSATIGRQPDQLHASSASISSPSVSHKQKSGSAFPGQTQIVFSNAAAAATQLGLTNLHVPQHSSRSALAQNAEGMAVDRRGVYSTHDDSANDESSQDESAELRGGLGALRLTCNAPPGANNNPLHDDLASGGTIDEVQEPSTPGREEAASPTQQTAARSARLGKRANSSAAEHRDAYELMYEETNALLKNLHFQRIKRIAGKR